MADRFSLAGRRALVTGGSRGLGRAMALGLAEAGADVAVVSRKLGACEAVVRQIEALGRRGFAHACHVGRWDELAPMADAAWEALGGIDVLVNNAGMSPLYPTLSSVTEDAFDKVIGVNFKGPFRLTALLGERMAAGEGGSVINISSTAAVTASPYALPYAGTKAALNAMTLGFAAALVPKVRVNSIIVGPFATDVAEHWADPPDHAHPGWTKSGLRVGRPEEIVGLTLYLASDASSFTSGAMIRVDGGPVRARRNEHGAAAAARPWPQP